MRLSHKLAALGGAVALATVGGVATMAHASNPATNGYYYVTVNRSTSDTGGSWTYHAENIECTANADNIISGGFIVTSHGGQQLANSTKTVESAPVAGGASGKDYWHLILADDYTGTYAYSAYALCKS